MRLTLAGDLSGRQQHELQRVAEAAAAMWEEEQHPGWSPAGADSDILLADMHLFQVDLPLSAYCMDCCMYSTVYILIHCDFERENKKKKTDYFCSDISFLII